MRSRQAWSSGPPVGRELPDHSWQQQNTLLLTHPRPGYANTDRDPLRLLFGPAQFPDGTEQAIHIAFKSVECLLGGEEFFHGKLLYLR